MVFKVVREVIGSDTPVRAITRDDCKAVRNLLLRLPTNATKRFPNRTLEYAAGEGERRKLDRLNHRTVNAHLNKVSTLFKWAMKEERMDRNPAAGLDVEHPDNKDDRRRSFTSSELSAIFSAPLFTGCVDDERGFNKPGPNHPRRSRFWVPLVALFAGMRQNEICQLLPTDIDEIAGVPVIRVRKTQSWQRLKSSRARRVVPVHPELLRIGFLQYVAGCRRANSSLLFPELKPDVRGYLAGNFQKRFATFRKSIGITDRDATFHSFRHTWRDALRRGSVPEERVQALGGWVGSGEDKNYGRWSTDPALIRQLASEIAKVRYSAEPLALLMPLS
jgi:integrase